MGLGGFFKHCPSCREAQVLRNAAGRRDTAEDRPAATACYVPEFLAPFPVHFRMCRDKGPNSSSPAMCNCMLDKSTCTGVYCKVAGSSHFGSTTHRHTSTGRCLKTKPRPGFLTLAVFQGFAVSKAHSLLRDAVPKWPCVHVSRDCLAPEDIIKYNQQTHTYHCASFYGASLLPKESMLHMLLYVYTRVYILDT